MYWAPGQAKPLVIAGVGNWKITLKLFMFNSTYQKIIVTVAIIPQVHLKWIPKVIQEFIRLS